MYRLIEHTADVGLRIEAPSLAALLEDAGRGLFTVIAGDLGQIARESAERFVVAGADPVWLLVDWASELHAAFELRRMLFAEFSVTVGPAGIDGTARGERFAPGRHALAHEVKAVTLHGLDVRHGPAGWEATLILDV